MSAEVIASCEEFIALTIETRGGALAPADGILDEVYPWGSNGAMAKAENTRLDIQGMMVWDTAYQDGHGALSRDHSLNRVALIGVSGDARQVRFVLAAHPDAEVNVIEVDPPKYELARATLLQTNLQDLKSGRLNVVNAEGGQYLSRQASAFDYVEADKVLIHSSSKVRKELYEGTEIALKPGGLFGKRDILALTWRVCAGEGFEDNDSTRQALAVLNELMPQILDNTWTKRGAPLWETAEHMAVETTQYASKLSLISSLTRSCQAPVTKGNDLEGMISQLIAIMPALGIERVRAGQPNNLDLAKEADNRWSAAEQFIKAVTTPGVLIALPDYNHFIYQKVN